MGENIYQECHNIDHMKITVYNFQKNEGLIKTSAKSTVDIYFEVSYWTKQNATI